MAARYLVSGGTGNWNSTTNWSATDGGASGASFPVNGDAVFFTTNSGATNITVNAVSACTSIAASGTYTGTLTFNSTLTVAGAVTFIAGMTIAGTSDLICNTTATLTSGGKTLTGGLRLSGTATFTLADNWYNIGLLTIGASTLSTTVNGGTIYASGGYTVGGTTGNNLGTSRVIMTGGTLQMSAKTTGTNQLEILIDAGTSTVTIGTLAQTVNPIIYKSGILAGDILGFPKAKAYIN